MNKIISFSLWGSNPKYTIGAIRNSILAKEIYPEWRCRFYVGSSVPFEIINKLKETAEVIQMPDEAWRGLFWRFYPASDNNVDIMISRDCDSRLSFREKHAVEEWENSKKGFHIMRDHPFHGTEILGGMFGVKKNVFPNMQKEINKFTKENYWQIDQIFLKQIVYPIIKNDCLVHDEFFKYEDNISFPTKRINREFVGDVFDEFDQRHPEYYKLIKMEH